MHRPFPAARARQEPSRAHRWRRPVTILAVGVLAVLAVGWWSTPAQGRPAAATGHPAGARHDVSSADELLGRIDDLATVAPDTVAVTDDDGTWSYAELRDFAASVGTGLAEAGLRPLSITPWGGVFGPAHMPKEIVGRVGRELVVVLKRPDVREAFQKLAFEPRGSTPEELAAFVKEQAEVFRRVVAEVGIKPE